MLHFLHEENHFLMVIFSRLLAECSQKKIHLAMVTYAALIPYLPLIENPEQSLENYF